MNNLADVENTAGGESDEPFGGAENHVDGNRVISVNFAPVNTNQQNFINVNSKIDFKAKVRFSSPDDSCSMRQAAVVSVQHRPFFELLFEIEILKASLG